MVLLTVSTARVFSNVAVGLQAAAANQSYYGVALGSQAAQTSQGANAVSIGLRAGQTSQGGNSVAIGTLAGQTNQAANSIVINATGTAVNAAASGFFVAPLRQSFANNSLVVYTPGNSEVSYGAVSTGNGNVVLSDAPTFQGNTTINGNASINNNLTVTGNIAGNVIGNTIIYGNLSITGSNLILVNSNPVMAMSTVANAGCASYVHPVGCELYSAAAPGVESAVQTPLIGANTTTDVAGFYGPNSIYHFWRAYVNLVAGNYKIRIYYSRDNNRGIANLVVNGTTVGTGDGYFASQNEILTTSSPFSIASTGVYKFEIQINSKNASSSAYYFVWKGAAFIRTS
jgi:hypothetical protein